MSLQDNYTAIYTQLEISTAPSISYVDALPGNVIGVHWKQHNRIDLLKGMDQGKESFFIVHELCHGVLHRAGYHSVGHSWIFLATFHLMLEKAGVPALESIRETAMANWNRSAPWPHFDNHIETATKLVASFQTIHGPLQKFSADEIAQRVIDTHVYKLRRPKWSLSWKIHNRISRCINFFIQPVIRVGIRSWHDFLGDTRGNWIAVELAARFAGLAGILLFVLGIVTFSAGTTFFKLSIVIVLLAIFVTNMVGRILKRTKRTGRMPVLSHLPSELVELRSDPQKLPPEE